MYRMWEGGRRGGISSFHKQLENSHFVAVLCILYACEGGIGSRVAVWLCHRGAELEQEPISEVETGRGTGCVCTLFCYPS